MTPAPVSDEVPIKFLNFNNWRTGDTAAREEFVQTVRTEFMGTGFFRLTNHGIPEPLILRNRELMEQFFVGLTVGQRMRYSYPDLDGQLGYTALDTERAVGARHPDHKHFLMFGDMNQLPDISEVPGFREASLELFEAYRKLYADFMEVVCLTLDLEPGYYRHSLGNSSLRLIHYPMHDNPSTGEEDGMEVQHGGNVVGKCNEPHTDIDALTLLFSSQPGLQLWYKNRWLPIPVSHDSLVVNCGDMLEHLTGGRYKSGIHRVICPKGADRYSMPFFGHFLPQTPIVPLAHLGASDLSKFRFQTETEYLLHRLQEINLRKTATAGKS